LYTDDWLENLRARNDLVQVVSQYVPLTQKNRRYWGCCPFHSEKTPSFSIDADKQLYYCFGCHAGGNVIHFLMNIEKLAFEAAEEAFELRTPSSSGT
jgi:DNA primase